MPSQSAELPLTTLAPINASSIILDLLRDRPCEIYPVNIRTLTWPDTYITVATVTTLVSVYMNTTVITSSTYADITASMELSSIINSLPVRNSRTSVLNGTAFTDPYGVVYHSPTAITLYDELKYLPAPTFTSGWKNAEWIESGDVFPVLPSGFYFSEREQDIRSWLASNAPSPVPIFWSLLPDCAVFYEIVGPQAYKHIVESITAYETTTTILSSAFPSPVIPAATPPLPTPRPTSPINIPNQPDSPGGGNVAAEPSLGKGNSTTSPNAMSTFSNGAVAGFGWRTGITFWVVAVFCSVF